MLRKRIITALFLLVFFLLAVFYLPNNIFASLMAVIILIGAWEWAGLLNLSRQLTFGYVFTTLSLMLVSLLIPSFYLYIASVIWWIVALLFIIKFPKWTPWAHAPILWLVGWVTLIPAWIACVNLQSLSGGSEMLVFAFVIVWGGDTGAYFSGRRWGKKKLAAEVSPGKTVEGFLGGMLTVFLLSFIWMIFFDNSISRFFSNIYLVLLTFLASVVGDLLESMIKRWSGKKDSSHILPGHGGVLDRIDGVCSALPVFALGLHLMGGML